MSNVTVRPAHITDCPALGKVGVSATNDAFRGIVPEECLEWTPEQSAYNWKRSFNEAGLLKEGEYVYIAENAEDGLVGFAKLEETRPTDTATPPIDKKYTHELVALQVAPNWQRQGIGRLLVSHVAAKAQEQGATHLLVRVLTENPNTVFYDRLGAVQLATQPYDWDGYKTTELIYGWENIIQLANVYG
jgi:GNAT superfamily N-acetyltransferase